MRYEGMHNSTRLLNARSSSTFLERATVGVELCLDELKYYSGYPS